MKAKWTHGDFDNKFTEDVRQRMSKSMKAACARGVFDNPEYRRKHLEGVRAARARGAYDGYQSSRAMKAAWARGDFDDRAIAGPPYKSTEIPLMAALDICGIEHISQYRPDGYRRIYDEFVPPNILIEVHGDYWHGPKRPENQRRDIEKARWAAENGFILIVIWESEIKEQGAWSLVHERILPLLGG